MRRLFEISILLLLLMEHFNPTNAFCEEIEYSRHICKDIQDYRQTVDILNIYVEAEYTMKYLTIENCNLSTINAAIFSSDLFNYLLEINIINSSVHVIEEDSFKNFRNLQKLRISGNNIHVIDGNMLQNLTELHYLELKMNQLKIVKNLCAAKDLRTIYVEENNSNLKAITIQECYKLKSLSLIGTGLENLSLTEKHFSTLNSLDISRNSFTYFSDIFMSNSSSMPLQILNISHNKFVALETDILGSILRNLKYLNLNNNLITRVDNNVQPQLNSLTTLLMNGNLFKEFKNDWWQYMSSLQILDIDNNFFVAKIEPHPFENLNILRNLSIKNSLNNIVQQNLFNGLRQVDELDLSSSNISIIENNAFEGLKSLSTLNLKNNEITQLHNGTFAGLKQLKTIILDGNKISSMEAGCFFGLNNIDSIFPKEFLHEVKSLVSRQFEGLSYNYLQDLDLSNLGIETLEQETFKGLFGLHNLDLHGNDIKELVPNVFVGIDYLTWLNLSYTKLSAINGESFSGVTKISTLDLSHSLITNIHQDSFSNLPSLVLLNLSYNKLITTTPGLYRKCHSLNTLLLNNNHISNIQAHSFSGLFVLKNFSILENKINNIEPGAFLGLKHLSSYLTASGIKDIAILETIHTDNFMGLDNILSLNFTSAGIQTIESRPFFALHKLTEIYLNKNNLHDLPTEAFLGPNEIKMLDLSNNNISEFRNDIFLGSNITTIIANENRFKIFNISALAIVESLQEFYVNDASIERIENVRSNFVNLRIFHLRNNNITKLESFYFYGMGQLKDLDLSGNPIKNIEYYAFDGLKNMNYLDLSRTKFNPLPDGRLGVIKSIKELRIQNSSLAYLAGNSLSEVDIEHLVLTHNNLFDINPSAFTWAKNISSLDLSFTNYAELNPNLLKFLPNLLHLNISNNNLKTISCNLFAAQKGLLSLDFNNNKIDNISICAFEGLKTLTKLNLSNNILTNFTTGTFSSLYSLTHLNISYNKIDYFTKELIYTLNKLRVLDISFNFIRTSFHTFEAINTDEFNPTVIGLAENNWTCTGLIELLENLRDVNRKNYYKILMDYGLRYDKQNVEGIVCY